MVKVADDMGAILGEFWGQSSAQSSAKSWRESSVWGACSADLKLALPEIACDNGAQHVAEVCGSPGAEGMFEP